MELTESLFINRTSLIEIIFERIDFTYSGIQKNIQHFLGEFCFDHTFAYDYCKNWPKVKTISVSIVMRCYGSKNRATSRKKSHVNMIWKPSLETLKIVLSYFCYNRLHQQRPPMFYYLQREKFLIWWKIAISVQVVIFYW